MSAKIVNNPIWNLFAGIIMLLLGAIIWFNPMGTMIALAFYIGMGFMFTGIMYLLSSIGIRSGWYLMVGAIDLLVGFVLVANLGVSAATLPVILALWCMSVGVVQFVGAYDLKKFGMPWMWSLVMGGIGVAFGLIILAYPIVGAVAISTVAGVYAILFGLFQLMEYYADRDSYKILIEDR